MKDMDGDGLESIKADWRITGRIIYLKDDSVCLSLSLSPSHTHTQTHTQKRSLTSGITTYV